MRRRWHAPENLRWVLTGAWTFGWCPIYFALYALLVPGGIDGQDDTVSPIFFGAWFGLPVLVALVVFAPRAARWLWAQRPKREWVSADDMRKVYRR